MVLSDNDVLNEIEGGRLVITPFESKQIREVEGKKVLSYGLSPAGYDVRLMPEWKVFEHPLDINDIVDKLIAQKNGVSMPKPIKVIDPLAFDEDVVYVVRDNELILPPNTYALASTLETFHIPDNITGTWMAKSTYARCGLMLNTTPVQPGFKGQVVMEFYNGAHLPIILRADQGFAQVQFSYTNTPSRTDYSKAGGYQGQSGVQVAKV